MASGYRRSCGMRLSDFILQNIEPILADWEVFARRIWPGAAVAGPAELRDDAEKILRATALDMRSDQTPTEQAEKSKGGDGATGERSGMTHASETHGAGRVISGFELWAVIAEYRALRASVLRLWKDSGPTPDLNDIDDLTRFNESIDQSLAFAVGAFTNKLDADRAAIVAGAESARTEADTANRAKDMFLATLSHELRTPLSAIVGWLDILRGEGCSAADLKEGLEVIERSTDAQVALISDVLDVSRIISGKMRLEIKPCELIQFISAGVDSVRPGAEAKGITLHLNLEAEASRASCDGVRIQQVVWNLVSNAVKFTPKNGRIEVSLVRDESILKIIVSDNGQGISPELLPFVFDRFRQADSSSRRRFGGLGIGLSIAKYVVEGHGGTITAESAGEGRGSRFTVRLPIKAVLMDEDPDEKEDPWPGAQAIQPSAAGESKTSIHRPIVPLTGLRVLVVDDEEDARRLLTRVMEQAGAMVTAASSAAEALRMLAEFKPQVLVSDLGMADEDGFALIRKIRALGYNAKALPAVALTAFAFPAEKTSALEAGFQVHIAKPVNIHDLTGAIAKLVADLI